MKKQKFSVAMEVIWLAVIFALPLLFFPNVYTTFELAKVTIFKGAVVLLLILWLLKYLLAGVWPMAEGRANRGLWLMLGLFCGLYLLAVVFSVAPDLSVFGWYPRFQGLLTMVSYLIFGAVIFFELRTPKQRERLILVLMLGFLAVCGVALLQKFLPGFLNFWNDFAFGGRIYGTMGHPNYLATYVVMIVPILVANIFGKKWQIFSAICLIVGFLTLLFALSRAGFLAVFVSLLFCCILAAYRKWAKKLLMVLAILPLLAGGFLWYIIAHQQAAWIQNTPLLMRFTASEGSFPSIQIRLEIWPATVQQILARPLVGYGPETFAVSFPPFAPVSINTDPDAGEIPDRAHNEILDLAVQIGIPGMVAYFLFLGGLLVAGARKFLRENDGLILGLSGGILGLLVANSFGFSVTVHWVFLVLFVALVLGLLHEKNFKMVKSRGILRWVLCLLLILLSVSVFWFRDVQLVRDDVQLRQQQDAAK